MTLAIFKYGLPLLLGYTLFVGVSGRLNPFSLPYYKQEHASWYLGIWTAIVVSTVIIIGLYLAYDMPAGNAHSLILPGASIIACLMAPALALYMLRYYRGSTSSSHQARSTFSWSMGQGDLSVGIPPDENLDNEATLETQTEHAHQTPTSASKVSPAYLAAARIDQIDGLAPHEAINDSGPTNGNGADQRTEPETQTDSDTIAKLAEETALREETEKHLRITRKALSVLEADTRHQSSDQADALIALEEQLATSIDTTATLEAVVAKETAKRVEIEDNVVDLKQKLVNAKQEIRRSAAARAKALSTANKSIAFARQSLQVRAKLESKLSEAQTTIDNRQKTVSSLIRALEKEKRKTQQEIVFAAQQLVINERQLKAKRSLEEVARSVENKLTSRLVKKVAKARPLTTDFNQGEG